MAQAEQHNTTATADFYLIDETQFCRLALFRRALEGLGMIAEGSDAAAGSETMAVTRDHLAALFMVLGDQLEHITGNLPLKG